MIQFIPIRTNHTSYPFIEQLMLDSFPLTERRTEKDQREVTDNEPHFKCMLITDGTLEIGLITLWQFPDFTYVEHLATSPSVRNQGYGKQIMLKLTELVPGLVLLEVELPENELSRRRIGFYERCGFTLHPYEYLQPPYHAGGEPFPLRIMTKGTEIFTLEEFEKCRESIYRYVYKYIP